MLSLHFGLPETTTMNKHGPPITTTSASVLERYYEYILGELEDTGREDIRPAEPHQPVALSSISGGIYTAKVALKNGKQASHKPPSPSTSPEIMPSTSHKSATTREPNKASNESVPLLSPVVQTSFIEQVDHEPETWTQPSFMKSRPSNAGSDGPRPGVSPTESALPLTDSNLEPSAKMAKVDVPVQAHPKNDMSGLIASSSKLASSTKSKRSGSVSSTNVTSPVISSTGKLISENTSAPIPVLTSKAGPSGPASRSSSKSSRSSKGKRPIISREGSQGSQVDLVAIASANSAEKRRLVATGRVPSAEDIFIRTAGVQMKRSREPETEVPERSSDATSRPLKKRKVDSTVEPHDIKLEERPSSRSSNAAVARHSKVCANVMIINTT